MSFGQFQTTINPSSRGFTCVTRYCRKDLGMIFLTPPSLHDSEFKYARALIEEKRGERRREAQDLSSSYDFGCGIHQGFNPTREM
ncbi:hypothetical protein H5410_003572 [Solanum commersonii]|uniref:Uncharacterized protein n=1 Tax=Solanum commersonii TaxID=4109 RepID=A0A9J6B606_SOLCO|nr:hypothetical protein H5410_003572 [Solanum commersonii]